MVIEHKHSTKHTEREKYRSPSTSLTKLYKTTAHYKHALKLTECYRQACVYNVLDTHTYTHTNVELVTVCTLKEAAR